MENDIRKLLEEAASGLRSRNINTYIAENSAEAKEIAEKMLTDGCTIAHGGSMSVAQVGLYDVFKSGKYRYLDRTAADKAEDVYRESFSADFFFTSANALTKDGVLYNVDGTSNRVAAIAYGPKRVIAIVGFNKIVSDMSEAVERVKSVAAPLNAKRLGISTYCASKGSCCAKTDEMCDGCVSDNRICCNYLATAFQRDKERFHVILVAEKLGL